MTVAQKFRPFQSTVFLQYHNPLLPQDTTPFTPKVGHELMTHGYSKRNIIWSPFSMAFVLADRTPGKMRFRFVVNRQFISFSIVQFSGQNRLFPPLGIDRKGITCS